MAAVKMDILKDMTRADFRKQSLKVVSLAEIAASFTKTEKDDQIVELIGHLFKDDEHFVKICDILGLAADAPPAPVPS